MLTTSSAYWAHFIWHGKNLLTLPESDAWNISGCYDQIRAEKRGFQRRKKPTSGSIDKLKIDKKNIIKYRQIRTWIIYLCLFCFLFFRKEIFIAFSLISWCFIWNNMVAFLIDYLKVVQKLWIEKWISVLNQCTKVWEKIW